MNEMQASLAEYSAELKQMKKVMADMEGNIARAESLRKKERAQNVANVKEYKQAQSLIENAISVLQAVFKARSARQNNAGGAAAVAAAAAKKKMLMLHGISEDSVAGDSDAEAVDGVDGDSDADTADAIASSAQESSDDVASNGKSAPAGGNADGTLTEAEMLKAVDAESDDASVDKDVDSALKDTEGTADSSDASADASSDNSEVEDANAAWFHSDENSIDDVGSVSNHYQIINRTATRTRSTHYQIINIE